MSFQLLFEVEELAPAQGEAVAAGCRERGAWPITYVSKRRRRRWWWFASENLGSGLCWPDELDRRHQLLSDDAEWDAPFLAFDAEAAARLASAVRVLGAELPQGFAFRATWIGDEVRDERLVDADELAQLIRTSQINQFTRYRVPARRRRNSAPSSAPADPEHGTELADRDWPVELDDRIAAVVTAPNPYWAATRVSGVATRYLESSVVASRLYQIWCALEDRFELEADDEPALASMRQAAREWIAVKDNPVARRAYLDHWECDVLGYERPSAS